MADDMPRAALEAVHADGAGRRGDRAGAVEDLYDARAREYHGCAQTLRNAVLLNRRLGRLAERAVMSVSLSADLRGI